MTDIADEPNPERSLLTALAAWQEGAPLTVSKTDLEARLDHLNRISRAAGGWNEHRRGEARRICAALDAISASP